MAVALKIDPKPGAPTLEPVARGVWCVRGGTLRGFNVYLLEDDGGVTMFDAGLRSMAGPLGELCERMGGLRRIVLGHAHPDHRGAAPRLGAPVFVHPDERADAESDGGMSYWRPELLDWWGKWLIPANRRLWDGGPVRVEGTVAEGDDVAGFEVHHFPGHAPGQIGLWRAGDRLAIVTDTVYFVDPQTGRPGGPRIPHAAFNHDTDQARESIRRLAALEPREVWAGHADPLTGDVRRRLEAAADRPADGEQR